MKTPTPSWARNWLAACLALISLSGHAQTVVDASTGSPVLYASVYDKATGRFLGTTDGAGNLPEKATEAAELSVQHINYKPATVELATLAGGAIGMEPLVRTIKEVTVDKGKHEYVRLKVFVRQMAWMTDTLAKVQQSVCHFYFKASKPTGTPKVTMLADSSVFDRSVLAGKNFKMARGIMRFSPDVVMKVTGPRQVKTLPADSVTRTDLGSLGGNWGVEYATFDRGNARCSVVQDSVWFKKPFTLPLTGIAMSRCYRVETYDIRRGAPKIANLASLLYGMRLTHKKSDTSIDLYNEAFVIDVDYASAADYQRESKAAPTRLEEPEGFQPLNDAVLAAMKNMRPLTTQEKLQLLEEETKKK